MLKQSRRIPFVLDPVPPKGGGFTDPLWGTLNFLGPPMLSACREVRDHINLPKNGHDPSYCYRAVQRRKHQTIDRREFFRAILFSTLSTLSAPSCRCFRIGI